MRIPPFIVLGLIAGILSCSPPQVRQFFPDDYFPQDRIYQNKPLRFTITFRGNWNLLTDPNEMDKNNRNYAAELQRSGVELLFIGTTVEGTQATRALVRNLHLSARSYAEQTRNSNLKDVQNERGLIDFLAGENSMIKWVYDKDGFRFVEFFFTIDTYDVRIAFWAKPDLFESFLPVYEGIMSTLDIISGL